MSVELMAATFAANLPDIDIKCGDDTHTVKASTAKFVLLALADHANDDGRGAYPSIDRLAKKTSLQRRTVQRALDALIQIGAIRCVGKSEYGTDDYIIYKNTIAKYRGDSGTRGVTLGQSGGDSGAEKRVPESPESSSIQPSINPPSGKKPMSIEESANRTVDGILALEAIGKAKLAPRTAMWDRADKELSRVKYNLSGARQAEQERFISFLIAEEKKGRSIEKFVEWAFRDEFWVGKINGLNKIMELWLKQDEQKPPAQEPKPIPEDNRVYTPMPDEIKRKLAALRNKHETDSDHG